MCIAKPVGLKEKLKTGKCAVGGGGGDRCVCCLAKTNRVGVVDISSPDECPYVWYKFFIFLYHAFYFWSLFRGKCGNLLPERERFLNLFISLSVLSTLFELFCSFFFLYVFDPCLLSTWLFCFGFLFVFTETALGQCQTEFWLCPKSRQRPKTLYLLNTPWVASAKQRRGGHSWRVGGLLARKMRLCTPREKLEGYLFISGTSTNAHPMAPKKSLRAYLSYIFFLEESSRVFWALHVRMKLAKYQGRGKHETEHKKS